MSKDRESWPLLVRLGLWGLSSRAAAWLFVWLCLGVAAGCTAFGFYEPAAFLGTPLVFAALWYYLAIRWVDRHGRW